MHGAARGQPNSLPISFNIQFSMWGSTFLPPLPPTLSCGSNGIFRSLSFRNTYTWTFVSRVFNSRALTRRRERARAEERFGFILLYFLLYFRAKGLRMWRSAHFIDTDDSENDDGKLNLSGAPTLCVFSRCALSPPIGSIVILRNFSFFASLFLFFPFMNHIINVN